MRHVPEIKLIRTDTTLDLSQKAEKVCSTQGSVSTLVGLDPWAGRYEFKQTISFFFVLCIRNPTRQTTENKHERQQYSKKLAEFEKWSRNCTVAEKNTAGHQSIRRSW